MAPPGRLQPASGYGENRAVHPQAALGLQHPRNLFSELLRQARLPAQGRSLLSPLDQPANQVGPLFSFGHATHGPLADGNVQN